MATKYYGVGVKWGNSTTGLTNSGITAFQAGKSTMKRAAKKKETPDGAGDTAGVVYYDFRKEITITVTPTGATIAAARANNVTPLPGTLVTFVDANDAEIAGNWLVDDASKETDPENGAQITMSLTQYANSQCQVEIT